MFLPELGKQIQGERHIASNNRVIRISAGSNNLNPQKIIPLRKKYLFSISLSSFCYALSSTYLLLKESNKKWWEFLFPDKKIICFFSFLILILSLLCLCYLNLYQKHFHHSKSPKSLLSFSPPKNNLTLFFKSLVIILSIDILYILISNSQSKVTIYEPPSRYLLL